MKGDQRLDYLSTMAYSDNLAGEHRRTSQKSLWLLQSTDQLEHILKLDPLFLFSASIKKKCKQEHTVKNKTEHQTKHDNAARSYNFRKWDHQVKKNNKVRNKTTKIMNRTIQTKSKEILKTCQIVYDNQITFVVRQADSYSIRYDDLIIKQPQNPSSSRKQTKP